MKVRCNSLLEEDSLVTVCVMAPMPAANPEGCTPVSRRFLRSNNARVSRARVSSLVMMMVNGIGANLTNEQKRAHLVDLRREHLIDQVCIQEILPPEK